MSQSDFDVALEEFPWESQEQKDGYLGYIKYARQFGLEPKLPIDPTLTFFIQKNHEAYKWIQETFGDQITELQNQIKKIADQGVDIQRELDSVKMVIDAHAIALKALNGKTSNG